MSIFKEEWLVGPENTKFYTRFYPAASEPIASLVFAHGFQEHITRYDHVFTRFATQGNIDVFAFDQRGWGRTACDEANKSPESAYGLTNRKHQLTDLEFFINKECDRVGPNKPVFLFGHSMGGGLVLSFATAKNGIPAVQTINRLTGLISSSPLIKETRPVARPLRWVAALLNNVVPWMNFPADVPSKYLTTDPKVNAEADADPLMRTYATIGCINDMLAAGDYLAASGYKQWPSRLPLLIVHGSEDHICSTTASKAFYDGVPLSPTDKRYISYPGAYHEIHNEPKFWTQDVDDIIQFMKERIAQSGSKL
ncbi:hypothetical protein FRB94_009549 [Tulasnella sp. JGI-2019a]|nr:hypothetical protein FRB93_008886 [Tulasnella sp. JGI-2019a]KAG8994926.1 hypothetical protein FRB94_009549 [Tulasnella sp. JGI-2019a]KAG9026208.1 hypothetical protein FRB95_009296 [Tulasnella sp. JGI-2019a]